MRDYYLKLWSTLTYLNENKDIYASKSPSMEMTEVSSEAVIVKDQEGNILVEYEKEYVRYRIERGEGLVDNKVRRMLDAVTGMKDTPNAKQVLQKSNIPQVKIPPPPRKSKTGEIEYEYFGWSSSNTSLKVVVGIIVFLALFGLGLNYYTEKAKMDKEMKVYCDLGRFGNRVNGRGFGYMMYIWQGRVAIGNSSEDEYQKVKDWFSWNCPDGW